MSVVDQNEITEVKNYRFKLVYLMFNICIISYACKMRYFQLDTPDDFFFAEMASGIHGSYCSYLLRGVYWLGAIYSRLFKILPICNWVTVLYILMTFLAFIVFGNILIEKYGGRKGALLATFFVLATVNFTYCEINFSKISAFTLTVGFLILQYVSMNGSGKQLNSSVRHIIAIMLIAYGTCLRINVAFMIVPFIIFINIFSLLEIVKDDNGESKIKICINTAYIKSFAVCYILIIILLVSNKMTYMFNYEWAAFDNYNNTLSKLIDYHVPSYEEHCNEYEELGVTENDLQMLLSWNYTDIDFFDIELLNSIHNIEPDYKEYTNFADYILNEYKNRILILPIMITTMLVLSAIWLCGGKENLLIMFELALCILEVAYLYYMGRTPNRVLLIPICALLIISIYFYPYIETEKKHCATLVMPIIVAIVFSELIMTSKGPEYKKETAIVETAEILADRGDGLYIWPNNRLYQEFDLFEVLPYGVCSNIIPDSNWISQMPAITNKLQERYGTRNAYSALIENDDIYIILDKNIDIRLQYFREHYGEDITYALLDEVNGYGILSVDRRINVECKNKNDFEWQIDSVSACDYSDSFVEFRGSINDEVDSAFMMIENSSGIERSYRAIIEENEVYANCYRNDFEPGEVVKISLVVRDKCGSNYYESKKEELIINS